MPAHRTKENQGIVATESRHTVEGMARGRKKRKSPPRKKPPTKKEKPLLAAPLAYGRLRRPPLSLLFSLPSAAAPPPFLALSALLSPLVGGCAAPPLCFSSRASFGRLRRPTPSASLRFFGGCAASLSPALSWAAGGPPRPLLFPLYQTINKPLTPSHVMNFFSFAIIA
jgi:hypothetical protein